MLRKSIALWLALGLVTGVSATWAAEKVPHRVVSERLIAKIPPSAIRESITVSPDSKRVAYAAKSGTKWFVVVDGKEGKAYDDIGEGSRIAFDSPDRLHYLALKDGRSVYLVEEKLK